jgi:hypothetical protein
MRPRVMGLALAGWLALAAAPVSAQTPATCNANLFDEAIARDKDRTAPGEIVHYRVALVNRSVTNALIGCNVEHVTANFRCPGPTGQPDGPTTNLVTDVDIPSNDSVRFFGPFACTMPDVTGTVLVLAGVFGTGLLDDGGPSPFLINKTISVEVSITPPPPPIQIPTLAHWTFGLLSGGLALLGLATLRRRRP